MSQASVAENEVKEDDNISIDQHMQEHATTEYRQYVRATVSDISVSLRKLSEGHPELM